MAEIKIHDNESIDAALRRFKRKCLEAGVLAEMKKREHYDKPSVKKKKKIAIAKKKRRWMMLYYTR